MDGDESPIAVNELNSELIGLNKESMSPKTKKLIGAIIGITVTLIVIIIIIIAITSSRGKGGENEKQHDPSDILAEINCIYNIQSKERDTILLSNEFEKNFDFEIYIDGEKDKYIKQKKFDKLGEHKVRYVVYEKIIIEK